MKPVIRISISIAILIVLVLASLSVFLLPSALPVNAPLQQFSAERAMQHVNVIAAKTHPAGSPELAEVRGYILNELEQMGYQPEIQIGFAENDVEGFMSFVPFSGELQNITARLNGTAHSAQDIVLVAHYDTTLGGPGAADDTSGVAVLLETARALKSAGPLINDVVFLFTDGEEANLLGSQLFASQPELIKNISLVINVESRGNRGPSIMFESSDGNRWLINEFLHAAPNGLAYSFTGDVYKLVSNVTDFTPFLQAGKSGLNFANLGGLEIYHNPQDTPENLNHDFLQQHGATILALAEHFGNLALDQVKSIDNAVFFTVAKSITVFYSTRLNIPFALIGLAFFMFAVILGLRAKKITLKGLFKGFIVSLLVLIASAVLAFLIQTFFSALYFKLENVLNLDDLIQLRRLLVFEGNKWFVVSALILVAVIGVLQWLFRKKTSAMDLFFGNLVTWGVLSTAAAFILKSAHYIFLWPFIFGVLACLVLILLPEHGALKGVLALALCAIPGILIYVPVIYLLVQSLTMLAAVIPLTVMSLPAALLLSTAAFSAKNRRLVE